MIASGFAGQPSKFLPYKSANLQASPQRNMLVSKRDERRDAFAKGMKLAMNTTLRQDADEDHKVLGRFFQPLDLHLQPADLLVQFLVMGGVFGRAPAAAVLKQSCRAFQQLLLSRCHLSGMHPVLGRQLRCRLLATARRQCSLRVERSANTPSLPSHSPNLLIGHPTAGILYVIRLPSFWGPPQSSTNCIA